LIRDERGTESLELALVAPALMLLIIGVLQFGLWHHANGVVQTAAQEAARVAAAEGAMSEEARARATDVLQTGLGRVAQNVSIDVSMEPEVSRVSVKTDMRGLLPIPGLSSIQLGAKASAFREYFRPENR
jgi:Flp pilus assembly protein TadG